MYYCRVLEGRARPNQIEAAMKVLQDRLDLVRKVSGFLFVQIMHAADEFIAVSSWRTAIKICGPMRKANSPRTS